MKSECADCKKMRLCYYYYYWDYNRKWICRYCELLFKLAGGQ